MKKKIEVKKGKKDFNARAAREWPKLAAGLLKVPADKFDMTTFCNYAGERGVRKDYVKECGYAGCAIGWLLKLVPETKLVKLIPAHDDFGKRIPGRFEYWTGDIRDYYGITEAQTDFLFMPNGYKLNKGECYEPHPVEVAGRLLTCLATGVIPEASSDVPF